ncbi:hypothetical protein ACIBCO_36995 [Streptomyces violascens]|uniref:hypothetical protein n=1 Tax=Streptomyces violascens TaxID=67381 RepID=UPI0037B78D50
MTAPEQTDVLHGPVLPLDRRPGEDADNEPAAGERQIRHAEAPPVALVPAPRPAVDPRNADDGGQNVGAVRTDTDAAPLPYEPAGPESEEAVEEPRGSGGQGNQVPTTLTVVDRYFLGWEAYIEQHGQEPTAPQLSEYLAASGIRGRNGSPIAASTLRRYLLECRIYAVWAQFRDAGSEPAVPVLMEELTRRGITGQYNRPLEAPTVEGFLDNFRRRYRVFSLDMSNSAP